MLFRITVAAQPAARCLGGGADEDGLTVGRDRCLLRKAVVQAEFEEAGDEDVIRKLLARPRLGAGVDSRRRVTSAPRSPTIADRSAPPAARRRSSTMAMAADEIERLIVAGIPDAQVSRSPTSPAMATIMPRASSPKVFAGPRACVSISGSIRRARGIGWAACYTRFSSPHRCTVTDSAGDPR